MQGSATINAATLITPGEISHTGAAYTLNLSYPAQTGANVVPDPYASTLTHAFLTTGMPAAPACTYNNGTHTWSGNCVVPGGSISVGDTLSANTQISGGLSFKGGTVNLSPGTYWITDGDLVLQNGSGATLQCPTCTNGGAGVTVILTTAKSKNGTVGTVTLGSNANLNLNPPTTGTFAGMVLIQDSNGLPAGTAIDTSFSTKANADRNAERSRLFPSGGRDLPRRAVGHGSAMPGARCQYSRDARKSRFRYIGVRKPWPQQAADRQNRLPCRVSAQYNLAKSRKSV